jgi:glycerol-3-phosphate dehydrogenase
MADYDLAVIGGGLTGASIARDAAGRGLRVVLFEQGDLAAGASSASARLLMGDLGRLERRGFFSVRRALIECQRQLRLTPHLVHARRFVIPLHPHGRPAWKLSLGLSIYDQLSPARRASAASLDLSHHEVGVCLQRPFGSAFEFSDAVADDSRLVILNALDAAEHGAEIRTGARCVRADREAEWRLAVIDRGRRVTVTARALVSAVGAWTPQLAETVLRLPPPSCRLVRESQIIVRRLFDHDRVYVLQHDDGRLVFVQPYGDDFTLIGMARGEFTGDVAANAPAAADIIDLCSTANGFFREQISPGDVVRTVCGVRAYPGANVRDVPRRGVIALDRRFGEAPLVTAFGGDMTVYRLQAEKVVDLLSSFYPTSVRWTAEAPLPGGDFAELDDQVATTRARFRFLDERQARRLTCAYGTRVAAVLADARQAEDLGQRFGDDLTGTEVRYLMAREWARAPDDILWRRSKIGMSISADARDALAQFMKTVA